MCWYNIDFNNLVYIRANTRAGAERRSHLLNNFGPRAKVFPTKTKMSMQLYDDAHEYWVKNERLAEANKTNGAPSDLGV